MLSQCAADEHAFSVGAFNSSAGYGGTVSDSPGQSCQLMAVSQSANVVGVTEHQCAISVFPDAVFPVFKVCEPQSSFKASADDYAAISIIFGAILTAACVIWGVKQIYNLIKTRPEA